MRAFVAVDSKFNDIDAADAGAERDALLLPFSGYVQLDAASVHTLNAGIARLELHLTATRMCEADTSDQWSIIESLATIGIRGKTVVGGAVGMQGRDIEFNGAVRRELLSKFMTPALAMTAYFAPCMRGLSALGDPTLIVRIHECIKSWLRSQAVVDIANAAGASPSALLTEFASYNNKPYANVLNRATMFEWLEAPSSSFVVKCPNLSKTVAAVAKRLASEASAERAFYAMRLTYTPERASMWPETVDMRVRALSFAKPAVQRALNDFKSEDDLFRDPEAREEINVDAPPQPAAIQQCKQSFS